MLTVTRKKEEAIIIKTETGTIEIIVKDIKGNSTRIGIIADNDIKIIRKELLTKDNKCVFDS